MGVSHFEYLFETFIKYNECIFITKLAVLQQGENKMPNRDGTGPEGKGPKTGRQMGNCNGAEPQRGLGRGCRPCGRGLGRGFRRQIQE